MTWLVEGGRASGDVGGWGWDVAEGRAARPGAYHAAMSAQPFRLYNTLTRGTEPFVARNPDRITFYTCGPTVYDDAHIGNFRAFLAADLLRRWLESPLCGVSDTEGRVHAGPRRVVHVMNITDVGHMTDDSQADGGGEDKMAAAARRLDEAKKAGKLPPEVKDVDPGDPYAVAAFYTGRFLEDARKLGLQVAVEAEEAERQGDGATARRLLPRATDSVPGMIRLIERLIERGHAYAVGEAGRQTVYFDVRSFPSYGRLSGNTLDQLRAGEGGRVSEAHQAQKRHPADFLLWKSDPAHLMKWPSPWGEGYPGWHLECSAMSVASLVEPEGLLDERGVVADGEALIDLHSGGEDNIFPHHDCEIAQSAAAFNAEPEGAPFARQWFHPRFLFVEGEKMSKSRGNFFTARALFEKGHEPAAVRLELIRTHYRSNADCSERGLRDVSRMLERWRRWVGSASAENKGDPEAREMAVRGFGEAMANDLNVWGAIAAINTWVGQVDAPSAEDAEALGRLDEVLGVLSLEPAAAPAEEVEGLASFAPGLAPVPEVVELVRARRAARESRDFARADEIRDRLLEMGYAIKDRPGGTVEVSRA